MLLYRILISLVIWPLLLLALKKGSLTPARFGNAKPAKKQDRIWIHAASNGELNSVRPLIAKLLEDPANYLIVTVNSKTARQMALSWDLNRVAVEFAPFDLRWSLKRFLSTWSVVGYLGVETEIWPNRFAVLAKTNTPAALIAARLSAKTARHLSRFASIRKTVIGSLDWAAPQDAKTRQYLHDLGMPHEAITETVDMKALYQPVAEHPKLDLISSLYDPDTTILAASVHQNEDLQVLSAFREARQAQPDLHLIIAPRHPDKIGPLLAEIVQNGFDFVQNSQGQTRGPVTAITVADTLGDMGLWYPAARICFVGGSLVPLGGHTPWEPMAHGSAILHGPNVSNFTEIYTCLDTSGGALKIASTTELAEAIVALTPSKVRAMIKKQSACRTPAFSMENLLDRIASMTPKL